MALFNNKEHEALQAENAMLKEKIISFETRLSVKDKNLSECRATIDELEERIERLNAEIEKNKSKPSDTYSSNQVKRICQEYNDYISQLEEDISTLKIRPHNERGAGRKRKATPEQREHILSLFSSGISQNKIARMMTEQTGSQWNKTTIRNIIIAEKN